MLKLLSNTAGINADSIESVLDALPIAVCCVTLTDDRIVYVNAAFTTLLGYSLAESREAGIVAELHRLRLRSDIPSQEQAQPGVHPETIEVSIACKDGSECTVLYSRFLLPEADRALLTLVDITRRKHRELALREAEQSAREGERLSLTLLAHSHEMIVIVPRGGKPRFASPAVEEITGWERHEFVAQELMDMVHPEDRARVEEVRRRILQDGVQLHLRYRTLVRSGGYRWVEGFAAPFREPGLHTIAGYVVTLRDIAKQKEQEDTLAMENSQLAQLAQLDELTGIANRRVFKSALAREARRNSRSSQSIALLLLDIDNFKKYNDLYGHLQGDACLRQVAQTIKKVLHRVADLVARYGGEEFVILLPMTEPEGAEQVAQNILQAISSLRIPHAGTPYGIVTVSIGVGTCGPSTHMDEQRLMEEADRALYRAKSRGRNGYTVSHCDPDPAQATLPVPQPAR